MVTIVRYRHYVNKTGSSIVSRNKWKNWKIPGLKNNLLLEKSLIGEKKDSIMVFTLSLRERLLKYKSSRLALLWTVSRLLAVLLMLPWHPHASDNTTL